MYTFNSREHDVPLLDFLPQEQVDGDNSLQVSVVLGRPKSSVIVTKAMSIEGNVQWLCICNCNMARNKPNNCEQFSMEVNTTMGLFNTLVNAHTTRSPIFLANVPLLRSACANSCNWFETKNDW